MFDLLTHWRPQDFPGGPIDYLKIRSELQRFILGFQPTQVTFDQFENGMLIQELQRFVSGHRGLVNRVEVFERTATHASNWRDAEAFKAGLALGLVHSPYVREAEQELLFVQVLGEHRVGHPTSGPVQTDDLFDVMATLASTLIGDQIAGYYGQAFSAVSLHASQPGGLPQTTRPSRNEEIATQFRQVHKGLADRRRRQPPERGGRFGR